MILAIGLLEVEWRQPFEDLCGTSDINIQGLSVCSLHSVIQFHPHLPQKPRTAELCYLPIPYFSADRS